MGDLEDVPPSAGRVRLLAVAADLVGHATLADAAAFLGPRAIARAAEVSLGTVTHHFPADGEPLATAVLAHAIGRVHAEEMSTLGADLTTAIAAVRRDGVDAWPAVEEALRANLEVFSPQEGDRDVVVEAEETALFLAAAVAPRDPTAAALLRAFSEPQRVQTEMLGEVLLDVLGRTWAEGLDGTRAAMIFQCLVAGFVWYRRYDPESVPVDLYAATVIRLFDALTVAQDGEPEDYRAALVPRLAPERSTSGLDPEKRAGIAAAAVAVYRRGGWSGLTVARVAREAGVSRPTVAANFSDRNGLAAAVWLERNIAGLEAVSAHATGTRQPLREALREVLLGLVAAARRDRELTGAFMAGVFAYSISHGAPSPDDPADPRVLVPLHELLSPLLTANSRLFRAGNAGTPVEVRSSAVILSNQVMHLALMWAGASAPAVADRVLDTTVDGMLSSHGRAPLT